MTDKSLKKHVQSALDLEPSLDARDVGVSVDEGVVTLRGNVASYAEKMRAERVALGVSGVKGMANDLVVHLMNSVERTDTEIARAAVAALKWNAAVPADRVTVAVAEGRLTLNGTVDWQFQKDAAAWAVRDLKGVKGVVSAIAVEPRTDTADIRDTIEAAFKRSAELDARRITVTAADGDVILTGSVKSWTERREAERAAWAAPGVKRVDDRLTVAP